MLNKVIVNLGQIKRNADLVKKRLPKETKFCAVVKADAYGHGASMVANALYSVCDCFAVALTEEGVSLRLSGIDKDILVLSKFYPEDISVAVYNNLTLTLSSYNEILQLEKECIKLRKKISVHIKYNTGMNRQGVNGLKELERIVKRVAKSKFIKLDGLYSHYSCPEKEEILKEQTDRFLLAIKLVKGYNNNAICHISSSGGFIKGKYFDMVRIGILLYGYKPFDCDIKVKPTMKVLSKVVCRRTIYKKESALYGDIKAKKRENITIIRYGYADGSERKQVKGQFNNRCMDLTALTGLKKKSGYITVMKDAAEEAKKYKTIPYEILVKCGLRGNRIYKT